MILECTYDIEAVGNPFFKKIYDKVFNELVNAILSDQALLQKISKRKDKEDTE